MRVKTVTIFILVFFLTSLLLLPITKGGIKGTIVDNDNNPIKGVKITIISVEYPSEQHPLITNKKGEFVQIGLDPGFYQIRCEKEGFFPSSINIKISISEIFEIQISLDPIKQQIAEEVPGRKEMRSANDLYQEGRYEEALKEYQEAVHKKPEDPIGYYNLGITYMALGKQDEAINAFKKTIEIKPDHFQALKNLGQLYGKKKNFEAASKYYARSVKISADDPEVFFNLGVSLMNLSDKKGALDAFQKSVECKEDYADSYYQLGLLYLNLNKMDEARTAMEKFLKFAPDNSKALSAKKILEVIKDQKKK